MGLHIVQRITCPVGVGRPARARVSVGDWGRPPV